MNTVKIIETTFPEQVKPCVLQKNNLNLQNRKQENEWKEYN